MEMPKSKYDQTKQNDTPRVAELTSVQDVISVVSIDDSGIFELPGKRYSKLYALSDINFAGVTDEEQKSIIINFSKVLKAIPCRFSYTVANEHVDERAFHEKVLYPMKGDKYDPLRKSYNKIIADKVSDAKQGLYLDKVGNVKVDEKSVSDGGTVMGLTKDKKYTCEFYTGTYYQDFNLTANIHCFGSMERFVSYDYEFMHSNFIVIEIPEYFKSGYYFVNGVGLFRYVADGDVSKYNGKAYDESIDWNDPIILYDDDGVVIYDPSDPDFEENQKQKEIEEKSDKGDEDYDITDE